MGAIDYTNSNRDQTDRNSLHFLGEDNQYEQAIKSVGGVIEPYDSDKLFPFYGFGGIPRHMGIDYISHCFPVNGQENNPEIKTIEGVLQTYRQTLPSIEFRGPTYFQQLFERFLIDIE